MIKMMSKLPSVHFRPEREHRSGVDDGPDLGLQRVDVREAGRVRQEIAIVHLVLVVDDEDA